MSQDKKRNITIGILCGILLLMVVGYAAFNSILDISGTSRISSNWNIKITNIVSKNIVGGASNAEDPTGVNSLTATFKTNLVSPGDSIEYDIIVENLGTLDAKLDKITLTESDNPAIRFLPTGLKEGDILKPNVPAVLTVKVEYDKNVTSQPKNILGTLSITLDYVQADGNEGDTNNSILYSFSSSRVNIGDSVSSLGDTSSDYMTLGKDVFLKHFISDDAVINTEICFIKDDSEHCLKPGDFETNKNNLINIFGEDVCGVIGDTRVDCNLDSMSAGSDSSDLYIGKGKASCSGFADGSANCFEF